MNFDRSRALKLELDWLANSIDQRLAIHFREPGALDSIQEIRPPDSFDTTFDLDRDERLVLALALAPHVKPRILDRFLDYRHGSNPRRPTEFGEAFGGASTGFAPTGETALFLVAGDDLEKRAQIVSYFAPDHLFAREGILSLSPVTPGEPQWAGRLCLSEDYADFLLTGRRPEPRFGPEFPASRLTTALEFDDLILRPHALDQLSDLIAWADGGREALARFGLSKRVAPGFKSLFHGPPGTGKTLAAALLGKRTGREVFRVDLASVVSKWIGETEKNLATLFDRAAGRNWILFFDEADALFGKRSETKQSQDRYANQEVAYLLQRIETHDGLILMASNKRDHIDTAFLRRFHSVIHFPAPDAEERLKLWQRAVSQDLNLDPEIDLRELATRHKISGGLIVNALRYAVLRSINSDPFEVSRETLLRGVKLEMAKHGLHTTA